VFHGSGAFHNLVEVVSLNEHLDTELHLCGQIVLCPQCNFLNWHFKFQCNSLHMLSVFNELLLK
jgi:hypothetical protein